MRLAAAGIIATDDSSLYANGVLVLITAGLLICDLAVILLESVIATDSKHGGSMNYRNLAHMSGLVPKLDKAFMF